MGSQDQARIGAYLLRKLPERDRDEFEARILEEAGLFAAVRQAETAILGGSFLSKPLIARPCVMCFLAGAVVGAALACLMLLLPS
jgi:hypothetical protein